MTRNSCWKSGKWRFQVGRRAVERERDGNILWENGYVIGCSAIRYRMSKSNVVGTKRTFYYVDGQAIDVRQEVSDGWRDGC